MTNGKDSAFSFEGGQNNNQEPERGLTKREYFAAMAMQGMLCGDYTPADILATHAVKQADALIEELNKESK